MHGRLPRWKRLLFWSVCALLSGTAVLAAMEVALRVVVARTFEAETDGLLVPSAIPGLGYQLAANYRTAPFDIDDRGLRRRPADAGQPQRTVLLLGDSVAFAGGVPYDQSFGAVLEATLTAQLGETVAVWNGAVPGYNTEQEAILLDHLGPVVTPHLIVVQVCLNDYLPPPALTAGAALDATATGAESPGFSLQAFLYSSRALFFLKEKFKDAQKTYPEWFPVATHYIHHVHRRAGWANVKSALLRMQQSAARLDAQLLVVLFPVEQQLRIGDRAPQQDLAAFADAHDLPVLDLYEPFRQRWRDGLFFDYFEQVQVVDKLHLNARGHALAAARIADEIRAHRPRYLPDRSE
jgi:lysophospholipase L1-like esterase